MSHYKIKNLNIILMELKFMTTDEIIKVFTNTTIYFITTPASSLIHFQRGR